MNGEGKKCVWNNEFKDIEQKREYRGQWSQDRQTWTGVGCLKFKDGSMYQGFTANKKIHGKGRMTHANGDIYQGEWKDGKANGQGVFMDAQGSSLYEGEWLDDQ